MKPLSKSLCRGRQLQHAFLVDEFTDKFIHKKCMKLRRLFSLLLALSVMLSAFSMSSITSHATDYSASSQGNGTYGKDMFDAEYACGWLTGITSYSYHGMTYMSGSDFASNYYGTDTNGNGVWLFSNTSKSSNVYAEYYGFAMMNGKSYDVREYVWCNSGTALLWNGWTSTGFATRTEGWIYRELHFYEAGTLKSGSPVEIEWKGIISGTDIDLGEAFGANHITASFSTNPTRLSRSGNMFCGTIDNSHLTALGDACLEDCIWLEAWGTPESPLVCTVYCA